MVGFTGIDVEVVLLFNLRKKAPAVISRPTKIHVQKNTKAGQAT